MDLFSKGTRGPAVINLYAQIASGLNVRAGKEERPVTDLWIRETPAELLEHIGTAEGDEAMKDIIHLAILLKSCEVGTPGSWEFTEEELSEAVSMVMNGAILGGLLQSGLLEKCDHNSLFDPEGIWKITEAGREESLLERRKSLGEDR